ncbi:hypothetical protein [Mesonia sp.]|uniref:hypothetical protein n=1 Tax=Mesonia sp. TaxID=1960830 RepID=UPI003F9C430F
MNKLTLIILTLILTISCTDTKRTDESDKNKTLVLQVDRLKIKNDSLSDVLKKPTTVKNYWYDSDYDGRGLMDHGITNPKEFIKNSLRENTNLIPLEAVLGGSMRFGKIQLLGSTWLIAEYDDGHVLGKAIYSYKLHKNGELEFELLDAIGPE